MKQIGLPFFSDPERGEQVRVDPTLLPAEEVQPRAAVYLSGLRLVFAESNSDIPAQAHQRERTIKTLRAELMLVDPDLEPLLVKEFRVALDALKQQIKLGVLQAGPESATSPQTSFLLGAYLCSQLV